MMGVYAGREVAMDAPLETTRPRWGAFSVVSHQDARALTADVLLYDRLLFPTPTRDSIRDWRDEWDAELQEHRLAQLGGLVHRKRWDGELRSEWSRRWQELREVADMAEHPEYNLTMAVLADSAQRELEASPLAPVVVAAYQSRDVAFADFAVRELPDTTGARAEDREQLQRRLAALFQAELEMPDDDDPEVALQRAIDLAHDPAYKQARRSLYAWQDEALSRGWTPRQSVAAFEEHVRAHDALVRTQRKRTVRRRIWRIASFLAAPAAGMATGQPLVGLGTSATVKLVEARFPTLHTPGRDLDMDPAATLAHAISAVCHD
jgi:hypothetical protein